VTYLGFCNEKTEFVMKLLAVGHKALQNTILTTTSPAPGSSPLLADNQAKYLYTVLLRIGDL